eukprot:403345832
MLSTTFKAISLLIVGCVAITSNAARTFNIPPQFSGVGEIFQLNQDGTLSDTQGFTLMKASTDLNLALNSLGQWKADATGAKVQSFTEQNFQDFAGGFGMDYKSSTQVCDQYNIPSEQSVEEVISGLNNPYDDKSLTFLAQKPALWDKSEDFYIFNRGSGDNVSQQVYYSDKTGLLRYSVLYQTSTVFVFDLGEVFKVPESDLLPRDFMIKECLQ